jgi:hypothetical protein
MVPRGSVLLAGGDNLTWARDIEVAQKPCALPVGASRDQNQNDLLENSNHLETAEDIAARLEDAFEE